MENILLKEISQSYKVRIVIEKYLRIKVRKHLLIWDKNETKGS